MSTAVPAILLVLAGIYLVGYVHNLIRADMLRARIVADLAHPEGPPPFPASGAAQRRTHGVPIADTGAMHAVRDELLARHAVDVVVCDPAVTPTVPRWFQAWEQGRWTP